MKSKEDSKTNQARKNSGIKVEDSIDEEEEDDCKTKNLAKYLGMKDGTSMSISSQVIIFTDVVGGANINNQNTISRRI